MTADLLCIAHRGASGREPENTLLAIRTALDLGAPWVEIDVHCTSGEALVIHDDTLDRTTSGSGPLDAHNLEYLRSVDAGKGEQIPLLTEVLDLLAGRAGLNIELKGAGTAEPVAAVLGNYLQRGVWQPQQLLVSSFDQAELQRFIDQAPEIPIGLLVAIPQATSVQIAVDMGAASLNLPLGGEEETLVKAAHKQGLKVLVFTVNTPDDLTRMRQLGVDGIFTDYPERFPELCFRA